jgi:multiple sugar transport system permease protein
VASRAAAVRPPARVQSIWRTTARFGRTWPYLLPALFFFVGWQLWPIVRALWISFTSFSFLLDDSPESAKWIGLRNYTDALHDPLVRTGLWHAAIFTAIKDPLVRTGLWHAAVFTLIFLPGMIFLPMVIAVLVDRVRNRRLAATYRLILLIPAMIPGPLIFILGVWMYSTGIGPINYVLVDVFHVFTLADQPIWLGDTSLTFFSLALMEWWWGLGFHTMFYLAGLSTIPKELYESARVDGASEWRIFWRITFPRLRPILLVLVVLRFGTAFALIDEYILTGGFDRARPTYTWTVYMWDTAFQIGDQNRGYAAAIGWIGTIGMLAVVLWLFYLFRNRD